MKKILFILIFAPLFVFGQINPETRPEIDPNDTLNVYVIHNGAIYKIGLDSLKNWVNNAFTESQTLSFVDPSISISGGNSIDISSIDTDTQLSQEQVEDHAGGLFNSNTESRITSNYNDATGKVDLTVESNLSNYTNDAGFLTSEVDGSTSNEIQSLSFSNPNLSISGGNSVDLSGLGGGSDTHLLSENKTASADRSHDLDGNSLSFTEGSQNVSIETASSGALLDITETNNGKIGLKVKHTHTSLGQSIASFENDSDDAALIVSDFGVYTSSSNGVGMLNPIGSEAWGFGALNIPTSTGLFNTGVGYLAGDDLTSGGGNALFGSSAGAKLTTGGNNMVLGSNALLEATTHSNNVAVGSNALKNSTSSDGVAIGFGAAESATSADGAVIIGPEAGRNYSTSLNDKLIVHNSSETFTSTIGDGGNAPLIYGDFNTEDLLLSGLVKIRDSTNAVSFSNNSAVLELESEVRGFLPPRMTTSQRTALGVEGLVVHDTDLGALFSYGSSSWNNLTSGGTPTTETFNNVTSTTVTVTATISGDNNLHLYIDGLLQTIGGSNDYTRSGQVVTFVGGALSGERVTAIVFP